MRDQEPTELGKIRSNLDSRINKLHELQQTTLADALSGLSVEYTNNQERLEFITSIANERIEEVLKDISNNG